MRRLLDWLHKPIVDQFSQLRDELATVYRTEAARKKSGTVAVEFTRELANACRDWSKPVQVRFVQMDNGEWTMEVRAVEQALHEHAVAQRAARQ